MTERLDPKVVDEWVKRQLRIRQKNRSRRRSPQPERESCPFCRKRLVPKPDGRLRSHTDMKGKHCFGSGSPVTSGEIPAERSVRDFPAGLPGLGKR